MGRPISYEMQMMFVGSPGAFEEAMNTGSGITRLDYIQSYDFSFNVERNPLKQIGSDSFATRQTQFAPDVNLNIQYYLNDGWNDKFIGLDISPDGSGNPFDTILSSTGDRNFYVSIAQNDGIDQNLKSGIVNSNVLGIGNCYITNYEISVSVNELATVSCSFVGSNANVQDYATSKYLPSVNTLSSGQNAEDANKNFALNFISNARTEEYFSKAKDNFTGGCPYSKCKITPDFQSDATTSPLTFGFFDAVANNFQSMQFSVQFDRKPLYGFGNNHPYTRKVQRPIVATLALSALIDDFQAENLSKIFHKESGAKSSILIEFFNFSDVKKFGLALDNLTLESYSLGARIGGRVLVETNWTVEIINGSESNVKMIGSYAQRALDSILVNESFAVENYLITIGNLYSLSKDKRVLVNNPNGFQNYDFEYTGKLERWSYNTINKNFAKIFTDWDYSIGAFGLGNNGKLWAWGFNANGTYGDNSTIAKSSPVAVYGNHTFCNVSLGRYHVLAIDNYGKAWGWGFGSEGKIGDNSTVNRLTPVSVYGNKTFCRISAGAYYSLAIDKYGKAWAWGWNYYGGLGNNSLSSARTPVAVYGDKTFCEIDAGFSSSAIDKNGTIWSWGLNGAFGRLGNNSTASFLTPVSIYGNKTFCQVITKQVALGLDKNGKLWSWGGNIEGMLGNNQIPSDLGFQTFQRTPVAVCGNHTFCKIFISTYNVYAIDNRGRSWAWGGNTPQGMPAGEDSATINKSIVELVGFNKRFSVISEGAALDKDGQVWGWGYNEYGSIGNNSTLRSSTPVKICGSKKTFCEIRRTGRYMSAAIDKYGRAWTWGRDVYNFGTLGNGSSVITSQFTPVSVAGAIKTFCSIQSDGQAIFCNALDKYGKVWSWGANFDGVLGLGPGASYGQKALTPVSLYGNKTFCKIDVGGQNYSIAIDKNGKGWGWGYCAYGTLGIGDVPLNEYGEPAFRGKYSPVEVCGNHTFCEISCGYDRALGLDKNGKIWQWGAGSLYTPVSIAGANKTFCKITAGNSVYFATDYKNNLWAWGFNGYNNLGIGSTLDYNSPVLLSQNKLLRKIFPDKFGYYVYGLNDAGQVFTWGLKPTAFNNKFLTPIRIYGF